MNKEILERRIERLEGQLKAKDEVIDKLVAYNKNSGYLSSNLANLEDRIQKAIDFIEKAPKEAKIWERAIEINEPTKKYLLDILKGEE